MNLVPSLIPAFCLPAAASCGQFLAGALHASLPGLIALAGPDTDPAENISLVWRPFIDPINAHRSWYLLLIPMALFISIVYKAVRVPDMQHYWRKVFVMSAQIVLWIIALGGAFFLFIQYVGPLITRAA